MDNEPILNTSNNTSSPTPTHIYILMGPSKKKAASIVWNHFTLLKGCDPNDTQANYNYWDKVYGCHKL